MKKILATLSILGLLITAGPAFAIPNFSSATLDTPGTTKTLTLPPSAENSTVISLGSGVDPATGKVVEGLAIIHRKVNPSHKPNHNPPSGSSDTCYTYISNGAKWKVSEPWVVNPVNIDGLNETTVFNLFSGAVSKWEDATDGDVTNGSGVDVLGTGSTTSDILVADTSSPDNQNEAYFADISNQGVIAVTIVWGIFGGPPFGRELVEWDQIYDDVSFDWSADVSGVSGKMDSDNIITHEIGHSFGMGDLYNTCTEETMYGYGDFAETKKRDLNSGDITGINKLY